MKPEERRALIAKMTVSSRKQRGALLREYGIPRSTYAEWVKKEQARGQEGLVGHELGYVWNRIRPSEELQVVQYAKDHPEQYARGVVRRYHGAVADLRERSDGVPDPEAAQSVVPASDRQDACREGMAAQDNPA